MTGPSAQEVEAGQAVYSKKVLAFYDWFVLGFSNRLVWRCPTARLRALYDTHLTGNHLEVGVGTGYFLDRCRFPVEQPRLVLMDLNPNCLEATARRVGRYQPQTVRRNVLEPIPADLEPFDSIGINYVLHCLPGDIVSKAVVFDHLQPLLRPGGVIFGSTLLAHGVRRNFLARRLMRRYNARGIFCNAQDRLDDLDRVLKERFPEGFVEAVGCAALFAARKSAL